MKDARSFVFVLFTAYMLRKGKQSFPFQKAVQFFWKVKGKQRLFKKVERNWKGKV